MYQLWGIGGSTYTYKFQTECKVFNIFKVRPRKNTWIHEKDEDIVALPCPEGYCQENPFNTNLTGYDQYCDVNRQGTLCSSCTDHTSISLLSLQCSTPCTPGTLPYLQLAGTSSLTSLLITIFAFKSVISSFCCGSDSDNTATSSILLFFLQSLKYIIILQYVTDTINSSLFFVFTEATQFNFVSFNPNICMETPNYTDLVFLRISFSIICLLFGLLTQFIRYVLNRIRGNKNAKMLSFTISYQHINMLYFFMLTNSFS